MKFSFPFEPRSFQTDYSFLVSNSILISAISNQKHRGHDHSNFYSYVVQFRSDFNFNQKPYMPLINQLQFLNKKPPPPGGKGVATAVLAHTPRKRLTTTNFYDVNYYI